MMCCASRQVVANEFFDATGHFSQARCRAGAHSPGPLTSENLPVTTDSPATERSLTAATPAGM